MDSLLGEMDLAADPAKLGGCVVRDLLFGDDAAADLTAQGLERFDAAEQVRKRILQEILFIFSRNRPGGLILRPVRSHLVLPAASPAGA